FLIAEKDLEARGPGDLLGSRQSGLPTMRVADPVKDLPRLGEARRDVVERLRKGERIISDLFGDPRRGDWETGRLGDGEKEPLHPVARSPSLPVRRLIAMIFNERRGD